MIRVRLKEAMENYRIRHRKRITYAELAKLSGLGEGTLNSIGSRLDYQPNLKTVEKICRALDVPLHDMLEMIDDPPKKKAKGNSSKSKKRKKAAK